MRFRILPALLLSLGLCAAARSADFTVDSAQDDGARVGTAILSDRRLNVGADQRETRFTRTYEAVGTTVVTERYASDAGGVTAELKATKESWGVRYQFTVTNGPQYLDQIEFIPAGVTIGATECQVLYPFRGGYSANWAGHMGAGSIWPGTDFSPIVTVAALDGTCIGITYFNPTLTPVQVYNFWGGIDASRSWLTTGLRYHCRLTPFQTATYTAEFRRYKSVAAHRIDYRTRILSAYMQSRGYAESDSPLPPGGDVYMDDYAGPGELPAKVAKAMKRGPNSTLVMWAQGDNSSHFFNPYPPQLSYFADLPKVRGARLGALIAPQITPPLPTDGIALRGDQDAGVQHRQTSLFLNSSHPVNRDYQSRIADALAAQGVNIAYWDVGGSPDWCGGCEWLDTLGMYKSKGISVMPETSCDVTAWTTGLWMEYPYFWGSYELVGAITPKASKLAIGYDRPGPPLQSWRDDARKKGVLPIVDVDE